MSEKIVEISEDSLLWIDERYNRLREENKRLNNIINELEEDIKVGFYEYTSNDSDYIEGYNDGAEKTSKYFINRIKELKENK